jgi:hypothetical protein
MRKGVANSIKTWTENGYTTANELGLGLSPDDPEMARLMVEEKLLPIDLGALAKARGRCLMLTWPAMSWRPRVDWSQVTPTHSSRVHNRSPPPTPPSPAELTPADPARPTSPSLAPPTCLLVVYVKYAVAAAAEKLAKDLRAKHMNATGPPGRAPVYLNRVRAEGVKFWLDGSIPTALLSYPFTTLPPDVTDKNYKGVQVRGWRRRRGGGRRVGVHGTYRGKGAGGGRAVRPVRRPAQSGGHLLARVPYEVACM